MVAGWRAESHVGARPGARMRVRRTGGCTLSTSAAASTDPPRPTQPSAGRFWFFSHLKRHGPPLQGQKLRFGRGRRCKGISSAAWLRVLLQHAGAVHPCTARTKSPCSDVLRDVVFPASAGITFALLEPGSTKPRTSRWRKTRWCGDRAQAGHGWPALACWSQGRRNQAMRPIRALPRLPPKPVDSSAFQPGRIQHDPNGRRTRFSRAPP